MACWHTSFTRRKKIKRSMKKKGFKKVIWFVGKSSIIANWVKIEMGKT